METGSYCAYNLTRNVLLSEQVRCVDESLDQAELLEQVMSGPGLDRHAGVWVSLSQGWIDLPRLLALDFAYLDERQTIVETGGVGPGAGFPMVGEGVTGALILANRRLAETGAVAGDQVRICGQTELAALVKAASQSSMETERGHSALGQVSFASSTPFEVSRYSDFVFEPFGGSLVYLPQADAPQPQSTEYFLPEAQAVAENAAVAEPADTEPAEAHAAPVIGAEGESAKIRERWEKRANKKPDAPQEEPHFYTPKPIRFFDPAAAVDQQEEGNTSAAEEAPARHSAQLSPELKAAILQIDEQLRLKEELEKQEKKKAPPKDKKRKLGKKAHAKPNEPDSIEAAHPAWEELSEPARPSEAMIAAEAELVEKVIEEAEIPAEIETELQLMPTPATPAAEIEGEITAETPVSAPDPIEETISSLELDAPADEMPPPIQSVTMAPQEAEGVVLGSASSAHEPASALPIHDLVPEAPPEIAEPEPPAIEKAKPGKEKLTLGERMHRWIGGESSISGNRRKGERTALPGMVAFYWSGGAPRPHEIVNISKTGFYLRTKELWLPDTLVRMTLQRPHEVQGSGRESISVLARVVRIDEDGVGHEFVTSDALRNVRSRDVLPEHGTNPKELEKFLGKN
ncbi:MAG TPA: PilZ domain-containing protein [Terracidiphilus sp.]|jgi:hypothetical protein